MARRVSLVRRIDCTGPWLADDTWTARIPSFHLVSGVEERCQKSLCDGSQKLVFSRGVYQILTNTTMFARVRGRMTKAFTTAVQCTMQIKVVAPTLRQCSFGADWTVCVPSLFPVDVHLEGRTR